ncbi:hypothetical protein ANO14919_091160 [Xylariales sp. No.14919]|nr:hypothetical protein ANO14919_091160 [Xylariales sp. No.14919]
MGEKDEIGTGVYPLVRSEGVDARKGPGCMEDIEKGPSGSPR